MGAQTYSEGLHDLVDELRQLESFFPLLSTADEADDIQEEIRDLESLIRTAGEPEDEHSMRALAYLQTELARKRAVLDRF
ncbi:MAG: hypothetical protein AAF387_18175 [Pseudomonadota bacterium]